MGARGQHVRRDALRAWWIGGVALAALVAGGSVAAVSLASGSSSASHQHSGPAPATPAPSRAELVAQLTSAVSFSPMPGSTGVLPGAIVNIKTTEGELQAVRVASSSGGDLPGSLAPGGVEWLSSGPLAYASSYRITGSVVGAQGVQVPFSARFSTVQPATFVHNTLWPADGVTVGVGQPVVVKFDHYITSSAAQVAALSHFTVSMSSPVPGGWHWFSGRELHFRPQSFWPTGEQVTVSSDLTGWEAGSGMWGAGSDSVHFVIGDSHVAVANLTTHVMTVTDNGRTIATYPLSAGRTQYPTMDGIHIVLDRESVVHMVSSTVGIPVHSPAGYDEYVYEDVHISDSGEYVHSAPWSVGAQGSVNVSHGCINLSPGNATTFFDFSRVGDIVEVVQGVRPPVLWDHGVMDWDTPWSQWTPATTSVV